MPQGFAVSPFWQNTEEDDWIQWDQGIDLLGLQESLSCAKDAVRSIPPQIHDEFKSIPPIQRNRYDAIVSRMKTATEHTGKFSDWQK